LNNRTVKKLLWIREMESSMLLRARRVRARHGGRNVDTLKSLVIICLLGAILYGVYTVASKPEQPLPPEIAAHAEAIATPPVIDTGKISENSSGPAQLLSPPKLTPKNPFQADQATIPPPPAPFTAPKTLPAEQPKNDALVQPATNVEPTQDPLINKSEASRVSNSLRNPPTFIEPAPSETKTTNLPNARVMSSSPANESGSVVGASYSRSTGPSPEEIAASQARVRLYAFHQAWKAAQDQVKESRHREALLTLSAFYNDTVIPPQEHDALLEWLDSLAARVIYSTEHYLAPEYTVRKGETLYNVAEQYHVPYLLLKNINGVRDPELMLPGTKLKIVPGPFRAEISLKRKELTLFVGGLYAGRFQCQPGGISIPSGEYTVKEKSNRKAYYSTVGTLAPNDPRNPYGGIWLDLGNNVAIHGTSEEAYADNSNTSLSLAPRDAEDVYGILSPGSQVTVKE
jgi:LysM repeat protein